MKQKTMDPKNHFITKVEKSWFLLSLAKLPHFDEVVHCILTRRAFAHQSPSAYVQKA